jgi:hypothetical protein
MTRRVRLWIGPVLMCAVDAVVTLLGQPESYWDGARHSAKESNPFGLWLLHIHPSAFVAGVMVSILGYVLLIERLPKNLARVASFLLLFLHALGAASWFIAHGILGLTAAVLWLLFASWLLGWSWKTSPLTDADRPARSPEPEPRSSTHAPDATARPG